MGILMTSAVNHSQCMSDQMRSQEYTAANGLSARMQEVHQYTDCKYQDPVDLPCYPLGRALLVINLARLLLPDMRHVIPVDSDMQHGEGKVSLLRTPFRAAWPGWRSCLPQGPAQSWPPAVPIGTSPWAWGLPEAAELLRHWRRLHLAHLAKDML